MYFPLHRRGAIRLLWLTFLASIAVLGTMLALLGWDVRKWFTKSDKPKPLVVYCAAALKAPMEKIADQYEKEYGVPVQLQFGPSQSLLASIEVGHLGDLYLPADDYYLQLARDKDLLAETLPLAHMTAVLAVKKGNPLAIHNLDDLFNSKARLGQANPDAAAIGKLTRTVLKENGLWGKFEQRLVVTKSTVNDVANDVVLGALDAAFVWDATVVQYPDLEAVPIPLFVDNPTQVSLGVLETSKQPTAALRFARYLAARDRGLKTIAANGFVPVDGDNWAETPELLLYAGAMLRPAVTETIDRFEEREGVKVTRVYHGCGLLVAQMDVQGQNPDAFFACDASFMQMVHERFEKPIEVSTNQLVILVPKGNPHKIYKLADLGKEGIRIGVGHEKQCALGALTQETLKEAQMRDPIMKNVKTQLPAGDMLVNELRLEALDAVIAYISNAAEAGDTLEAYKVDVPCAVATQPIAVGKTSDHKYLTKRLLAALQTRESRERFEALGFRWKATKQP